MVPAKSLIGVGSADEISPSTPFHVHIDGRTEERTASNNQIVLACQHQAHSRSMTVAEMAGAPEAA